MFKRIRQFIANVNGAAVNARQALNGVESLSGLLRNVQVRVISLETRFADHKKIFVKRMTELEKQIDAVHEEAFQMNSIVMGRVETLEKAVESILIKPVYENSTRRHDEELDKLDSTRSEDQTACDYHDAVCKGSGR